MDKKYVIAAIIAIVIIVAGIGIGLEYYHPASKPQKEVVIYADYGSTIASKYFNNFTKATGIKVIVTYGAMGTLTGKLIADSSNPQADVLFGGAPSAYIEAESHGIFTSYTPASIANQSEYLHGGIWRAGNWDWYPFTYAVLGMSVNTHNLGSAPMPTSFLNLTNTAYKGKIILENPTTSTTTGLAYFSVVYQYFLEKNNNDTSAAKAQFHSYVQGVLNNTITSQIQSDDENAEVALGQSSTAAITIDWTYMPTLYAQEDGYSLVPALSNNTVLGPTAMAIINGAPHMTYAKDFVNWVLSTEGQQNITTIFHKPPIIAGVPVPAGSYPISQVKGDIFPYNQTMTSSNFGYISGLFTNLTASNPAVAYQPAEASYNQIHENGALASSNYLGSVILSINRDLLGI